MVPGRHAAGEFADRLRAVRPAIERRVAVDARALAALRVSLGLLLLADLLARATDLVAFYTDAGALPRAVLRTHAPGMARLSLHARSGEAWVQVSLFLVAGAAAVALLVGYRTRLATVVSWLLLVSLHARNPVLLNAGDSVLRRLLFWGLFLPLGGRWSVDALRRGPVRDRIVGVATAALLVQVVIVYTANAAFKLRGDVWRRGDAMRYVFSLDHLTVRLGDALAGALAVLEALGWVWFGLIASSVLLILLRGRARTLLVAAFAAMHAGMWLTMALGLFPLISIAALLPFLPPRVWDGVETRLVAPARQRVGGRLPRPAVRRPRPEGIGAGVRARLRGLRGPVVAVLLVAVLGWNAATLGYVDPPDAVTTVADPAEHRWDMFAPSPPRTDAWYVVEGRLASGGQVDPFRGSAVRWDRPPDLAATYPGHRWLVYLQDLRRPGYADLRPAFAAYLCERWNARHADDLTGVTVYVLEQSTRLDGPEPVRRVELVERSCAPGAGG